MFGHSFTSRWGQDDGDPMADQDKQNIVHVSIDFRHAAQHIVGRGRMVKELLDFVFDVEALRQHDPPLGLGLREIGLSHLRQFRNVSMQVLMLPTR